MIHEIKNLLAMYVVHSFILCYGRYTHIKRTRIAISAHKLLFSLELFLNLQPSKRDIYPIFTAEDGNVYIRRNATTEFMSRESVIKHAENMKLLDN